MGRGYINLVKHMIAIVIVLSFFCTNAHHRNLVDQANAIKSVISGTGAKSFIKGTTANVEVQAKYLNGSAKTIGGDVFMVVISNEGEVTNSFLGNAISGQRQVLPQTIYDEMIDHENGTYTYEYTANTDGTISLSVFLLIDNRVYVQYWPNSNWSGPTAYIEHISNINSYWGVSNVYPGRQSHLSARFSFCLRGPETNNIRFYVDIDDTIVAYCNGDKFINFQQFTTSSVTYAMTYNKLYYGYISYTQFTSTATLSLGWSYSSQSQIVIPSSEYYYPIYVTPSPLKVTVECPCGYTGYPTHPVCTSNCGNSK